MAFPTNKSALDARWSDIQLIIDALTGVSGGGDQIQLTQYNNSSNYALDVRNLDTTNGYGLRVRDGASAALLTVAKNAIGIGATTTDILTVAATARFADGLVGTPEISFSADTNTGLYRIGADNIGVSAGGARVLSMSGDGLTIIDATNDNAYREVLLEKARGTLTTPTAITSGDTAGAIRALVHDGTDYNTAASISFTTSGAVSAGNSAPTFIEFQTRNAAFALARRMKLYASGGLRVGNTDSDPGADNLAVDGTIKVNEVSADLSAADLTSGANAKDRLGFYMKNDKLVFAYNNAGTVTYITIPLDGSTATWTHSTSAP